MRVPQQIEVKFDADHFGDSSAWVLEVLSEASSPTGMEHTPFIYDITEHTYRLGWRWAFLLQLPVFVLSYCLTEYNLRYVTAVGCLSM